MTSVTTLRPHNRTDIYRSDCGVNTGGAILRFVNSSLSVLSTRSEAVQTLHQLGIQSPEFIIIKDATDKAVAFLITSIAQQRLTAVLDLCNLDCANELFDSIVQHLLQIGLAERLENLVLYPVGASKNEFEQYSVSTMFFCPEVSSGISGYKWSFNDIDDSYRTVNRIAYDQLANEYVVRGQTPGKHQEHADYLASLLIDYIAVDDPNILELGSGAGDVLECLTAKSSNVTAVEISEAMAAMAFKKAPDANIIVADVLDIEFDDESYDGIYAGAFIHLFPKGVAEKLMDRLYRWLCPDGVLFLNTTIGEIDSESWETKSDYHLKTVRFRHNWTEIDFRALIERAGFSIVKRAVTDEKERGKYWVAYTCKKVGEA